jgi:hypothetical protein
MSTINRHNYESFFLLYTDNELSGAERKAVDEFVAANPDLQEELIMLQQSVLKPDNIVFDAKRSLLKQELVPTGIQEKLLLYLDHELTPSERNEIDQLIKSDVDISKEWDLLQQTKISTANKIVFEDKRSLYRKEEGRVIAFSWRKIAAAAVFTGFVVLGGLTYLNKGNKAGDNETAINSQTKPARKEKVKPSLPKNVETIVTPMADTKEIAVVPENNKKITKEAAANTAKKIAPARLSEDDIEPVAVKPSTNNLPKPYFDNVNNITGKKNIIANVKPQKPSNDIVNPGNNEIGSKKNNDEPVNTFASTTSFADDNENSNDHVLFMNEEKVKRSKLGGVFRKVKRVLERSTNIGPGDKKIKVANLEFAIQ